MGGPSLLDDLMEALRCLPGVGPKSAQRMAFHLLDRDREGGRRLAASITAAMERIGHCRQCRNFAETDLCHICADARREGDTLCVVENPSDVVTIDRATGFRGRFFVLHGRLSPLDGIGPGELGLDLFAERIEDEAVTEVILATSTTMEGEATAHYLRDLAAGVEREIRVSRIAHGVPLGGDLDYVDGGTLAHAMQSRLTL